MPKLLGKHLDDGDAACTADPRHTEALKRRRSGAPPWQSGDHAREEVMDAHNVYLNWIVYAVCGKLWEADAIMRLHGGAVREAARELREQFPVAPKLLHRGLLLTDADAAPGVITAEPGVQSTSFTEDLDCARWFACPEASVSGAVVERKAVRGYLMERVPVPEEILFHYSWAHVLDLRAAAVLAERAGAIPETGACQVEWALRMQSEVILEALREPVAIRPVRLIDAAALEAKYGPPARVFAVRQFESGQWTKRTAEALRSPRERSA